jgi:hypothetical protein
VSDAEQIRLECLALDPREVTPSRARHVAAAADVVTTATAAPFGLFGGRQRLGDRLVLGWAAVTAAAALLATLLVGTGAGRRRRLDDRRRPRLGARWAG